MENKKLDSVLMQALDESLGNIMFARRAETLMRETPIDEIDAFIVERGNFYKEKYSKYSKAQVRAHMLMRMCSNSDTDEVADFFFREEC